jgi:hypothetical protein
MQKIRVLIPKPENGYFEETLNVDENIGLKAGLDIYATARGTAKTLARRINPFDWVWINLTINDKVKFYIKWDSSVKMWKVSPF